MSSMNARSPVKSAKLSMISSFASYAFACFYIHFLTSKKKIFFLTIYFSCLTMVSNFIDALSMLAYTIQQIDKEFK
jgi:hypothetical protein